MMLAIHHTTHAWKRLHWIADMEAALFGPDALDWEGVWHEARIHRTERMLLIGLYLAHHLLEAPIPPILELHLRRDGLSRRLAREIERHLFDEGGSAAERREDRRTRIVQVRAQRSWLDQAACALRLVTAQNEGDWESARLPWALRGLYGPVRLLRLIALFFGLGKESSFRRRNRARFMAQELSSPSLEERASERGLKITR
jgi:hypothetical protein